MTLLFADASGSSAVLMHTGYYTPSNAPPPPSVAELRVVVRLLPAQEGALRKNLIYDSFLRSSVGSLAFSVGTHGTLLCSSVNVRVQTLLLSVEVSKPSFEGNLLEYFYWDRLWLGSILKVCLSFSVRPTRKWWLFDSMTRELDEVT